MSAAVTTDYAALLAVPTSVKKQKRPIAAIVGTGGIGKTTFACEAPNPAVICYEDGAHGILAGRDPATSRPFPYDGTVQDHAEGMNYLRALAYGEHNYKTVVIDALDGLELLLVASVVKASGKGTFEKMGWGKEDVVREELRQMQMLLEHCRNRREMGVIIIAHADRRTIKDPRIGDYASYDMKARVIGETIFNWADIVGFAHRDMAPVEGTKRAVLIGDGPVLLHWADGNGYRAKQRAGYHLPKTMALDWDAFDAELSRGPETAEELRARIDELVTSIGDEKVTAKAAGLVADAKDNTAKLKAIANGLTKKLQEKTS